MSQPAISKHLRVLERAGLVSQDPVKAQKVMGAMMKMKKIDIAKLQRAHGK